MRSRINYYFFLFATHLSHRAYSLTIFCKRDTYTRSDPIVMDRERNFSRDRQTSEKCTFTFFKKRKNSSSARFQEIFSVSREICGTRAIRYRGDFCTDGYLPCLASVPNTVGLITGKIGSPIYFFFQRNILRTGFNPFIPLARADCESGAEADREPHVADISCVTFLKFVLPRRILRGSKRTAFQRESRYIRRLLNNFVLLRERKAFGRFGELSCGKRDPTWRPRELRRSIPTHFRDSCTAVTARISISRSAYRTTWRTELDLATSLTFRAVLRLAFRTRFLAVPSIFPIIFELFLFPI